MGEGKEVNFAAFFVCAELSFLSCLHRGKLAAPVCDLQETQQKGEGGGGIAEASEGQKWFGCYCCCFCRSY